MRYIFVFICLFLQISFAWAQLPADAERLLKTYHDYGKLNGSVLIANKEGVIFSKGYGFANYEWQIPNTPQTRFRIASISKQFTAFMVMQLVSEGKLRLDDTIARYIPEYPADKAGKITIHHLLSHTSGIVHYFPDFYNRYSKTNYTPEELMRLFWDIDLLFEPGTGFRYSSFGYVVLGIILERVTGKSYPELLQERICRPLGMMHTGVDDEMTIIPQKASGYFVSGMPVHCEFRHMSTVFATGQIYSTTEDLHRWHRAVQEHRLLSANDTRLLFRTNQGNYGYGWMITKKEIAGKEQLTHWHTGGYNGFNSIVLHDVNSGYFISILANAEPTDVEEIANRILKILHGNPIELPRKSIAQAVAQIADAKGITAGIAGYQEIKATAKDQYDFAEGALIGLSEYYTMRKKNDWVIRLLELNLQEYPQSSWTYSNLASIYATMGAEEQAVKYYKKTLELFPYDSVAKTYLENYNKKKR